MFKLLFLLMLTIAFTPSLSMEENLAAQKVNIADSLSSLGILYNSFENELQESPQTQFAHVPTMIPQVLATEEAITAKSLSSIGNVLYNIDNQDLSPPQTPKESLDNKFWKHYALPRLRTRRPRVFAARLSIGPVQHGFNKDIDSQQAPKIAERTKNRTRIRYRLHRTRSPKNNLNLTEDVSTDQEEKVTKYRSRLGHPRQWDRILKSLNSKNLVRAKPFQNSLNEFVFAQRHRLHRTRMPKNNLNLNEDVSNNQEAKVTKYSPRLGQPHKWTRILENLNGRNLATANSFQNSSLHAPRVGSGKTATARIGHPPLSTKLPKRLTTKSSKVWVKSNFVTAKDQYQISFIKVLSTHQAPKGRLYKSFRSRLGHALNAQKLLAEKNIGVYERPSQATPNGTLSSGAHRHEIAEKPIGLFQNISDKDIVPQLLKMGFVKFLGRKNNSALSLVPRLQKHAKGKIVYNNSLALYIESTQPKIFDFDEFTQEHLGVESKPIKAYYPFFRLSTVCVDRSSPYNIPSVMNYQYRNVYSHEHKHRPIWTNLRRQIFVQGKGDECHNVTRFKTWRAFQYCSILRHQRLEYLIPKYPLHQIGYKKRYAFQLPND